MLHGASAAGISPSSGSKHRPRAFGRTSNVWQYVEAVHERATPPLARMPQSSLVDTMEENPALELDDSALHPGAHISGRAHRKSKTKGNGIASMAVAGGPPPSTSNTSHITRLQPMTTRAPLVRAPSLSSMTSSPLKNIKSLPELPPTSHSLTNQGNGNGEAVVAVEPWSHDADGLRPLRQSVGRRYPVVQVGDVLRRINALGTSASAPTLGAPIDVGNTPLGPGITATVATSSSPAAPPAAATTTTTTTTTATTTAALTATAAAGTAPPMTGATAMATMTPPAAVTPPLTEAERLRNDFNSQTSCRLSYGCNVALELFNGDLLMVSAPDGRVGVCALERMQLKTTNSTSTSNNSSTITSNGTASSSSTTTTAVITTTGNAAAPAPATTTTTTTTTATTTTTTTPATALPNGAGRHRAVFTLVNLSDLRSANSIRFGDAVYLQLSVGPGEVSWEQGGVLGAQVRAAPPLPTLALTPPPTSGNDDGNGGETPEDTAGTNGNGGTATTAAMVVGVPAPVRAYLPKTREDAVDAQAEELQARVRNKSARLAGKWIIRSARHRLRKPNDPFVYNGDEIFLEQDWFYLGADDHEAPEGGRTAVLRALPSRREALPRGAHVVERRAAWRIRLLDSSNGGAGFTLAQQQMERLLLRAKTQLKASGKARAGQSRQYGGSGGGGGAGGGGEEGKRAPLLPGGARFVPQLRAQREQMTKERNQRVLQTQAQRVAQLEVHLALTARRMHVRFAEDGDEENEGRSGDEEEEQEEEEDDEDEEDETNRERSEEGDQEGAQEETQMTTTPLRGKGAVGRRAATRRTPTAPHESVCALCRSTTGRFDLCSQIHHVMHAIHHELEQQQQQQIAQRAMVGTTSVSTPVPSGTAPSMNADGSTSSAEVTTVPCLGADPQSGEAVAATSSSLSSLPPSRQRRGEDAPPQLSRMEQLLATQDRQLVAIITGKEKQELMQRHAAAQLRARGASAGSDANGKESDDVAKDALSPMAVRFRHRFKHLNEAAAAIVASSEKHGQDRHEKAEGEGEGIGAHFHKLRIELAREELRRRQEHALARGVGNEEDEQGDHVEEEAQEEEEEEEDEEQEEHDPAEPNDRMFPTEMEMEALPPLDTKTLLLLYLSNKPAVVEMLDGFADLVEKCITPQLLSGLRQHNRTALVELMDFTARAAEFVCARRVQVRAAQLLHAMAESDVGAFDSCVAAGSVLRHELETTLGFVRFHSEKLRAQINSKGKRNRRAG